MRNFSNKTHVASQPLHRLCTALPVPRVPPRPFKPFACLADPNDNVNVNFLANGLHSMSLDNTSPAVSVNTTQANVTPALTQDQIESAKASAPSFTPLADQQLLHCADLAFTGEGSMDCPFTEIPRTPTPSPVTPGCQLDPLPQVISKHNPFLARAACWEDLHLVAREHGFDLDEFFKLTLKIKSRDVWPTSELSTLCKGDHCSCPHPSYSPDHKTLGPEYCADRLFFDEFYHDVNSSVNCDEWQHTSIMKDIGVQVPNVGERL